MQTPVSSKRRHSCNFSIIADWDYPVPRIRCYLKSQCESQICQLTAQFAAECSSLFKEKVKFFHSRDSGRFSNTLCTWIKLGTLENQEWMRKKSTCDQIHSLVFNCMFQKGWRKGDYRGEKQLKLSVEVVISQIVSAHVKFWNDSGRWSSFFS